MVDAAVADVVGPAVAAEYPDGLLAEILGVLQDLARERAGLEYGQSGRRLPAAL
jgi:hypothetical protein